MLTRGPEAWVETAASRDATEGESSMTLAFGCYDMITAKVARSLGQRLVYLTPFGVQAADSPAGSRPTTPWRRMLGRGLAIRNLGGLDYIIDGHTGMEGRRGPSVLVRDAEAAGASAIVLEDRDGFGSTARLRTTTEMCRELAKVVEARTTIAVIARTDSVRVDLGDAIERSRSYLSAGADLVMPLMTHYMPARDTPSQRAARMAAFVEISESLPAGRVVVHSPSGAHLPVPFARKLGFGLYLLPQLLLSAAATAMQSAGLRVLEGAGPPRDLLGPRSLAELVGVEQWLEQRW